MRVVVDSSVTGFLDLGRGHSNMEEYPKVLLVEEGVVFPFIASNPTRRRVS
jgi:hypothetical protein